MLKMVALLLGLIAPLSPMSAAQPAAAQIPAAEPAVQQAVVHFAQEKASRPQASWKQFDTMNGISLNDTKKDLLAKKGKPLRVTQDRLSGCTEYHYQDVSTGLCGGIVDYVHVDASSGKMQVNGTWVPLSKAEIERAFGKPQFVAEDGNVYIRGYHAIKVYQHPDSGALQGVDFFDSTTE
ncbi:hypothetical protein [Paenibacillus chibensis]|uniref:hypothetical protein n=1 Tax=Paenibacillus chibensis TaxID=59846 RepID=UPI000FD7F267|nr:hypothetical protein [Paenibacillus chibensis]MEC0372665.1 hypothetical protein [Paenibacillus chibensis]